MATADTIRVELVWKLQTVDWAVNVLHYTTGATDPVTGDVASSMATAIHDAFTGTGIQAHYADEVELDRIRVRDIRTDGNGVFERTINELGTSAAVPCPAQTCVVTTLRTTTGTRRGRGRVYWPAPATSVMSAQGTLGTVAQGDYNDFVTDLMAIGAGGLGSLNLSVLSRTDNISRTVTNISTDVIFDVQTRRRDLSI